MQPIGEERPHIPSRHRFQMLLELLRCYALPAVPHTEIVHRLIEYCSAQTDTKFV